MRAAYRGQARDVVGWVAARSGQRRSSAPPGATGVGMDGRRRTWIWLLGTSSTCLESHSV